MKDIQKRLKLIKDKLLPEAMEVSKTANKKVSSLQTEAQKLALQLVRPEKEQPTVTDHALVRYLERVKKIDLEQFRKEIITPERHAMIENGVREIVANGYSMKIEGKSVVTIV
jgi:hypothetical protein